ncbi:protein DpdJ [Cytobacillus firmus]|uniref:protein DpdJ n=1 Tax=Cytobacillus firmus TaxID=1399 RepID=UPI0021621D7C|nr:protein DpdJ [Cytobacillus firmus]MCS0674471.1 protein DpdJ [Cytobacillus firmus]
MNNRTDFDILTEEILTQIEMKENELLEWGFIGGGIDAKEEISSLLRHPSTSLLEDLIEKLEVTEENTSEIVKNLLDRKLLFELKGKNTSLYRSRYAETVRMLYQLKQRFSFEDWQSGKNLVSNIKPMLSYRKYPRRDVPLNVINEKLDGVIGTSSIHRKVISRLLRDGKFELSHFQLDSLIRILSSSRSKFDSGTVVGAGTGSGKTKSFYIPAFATLIDTIMKDQSDWTKIIGLYPRVELLKDQYREAVSEILALNSLCYELGIRPLKIGGLFGDTPKVASDVQYHKDRKWKKIESGYESPFFTCPECSQSMVWREEDVEHGVERLHCSKDQCDTVIEEENIVLTRDRMNATAPDIIFTTTEMINKKLPNSKENSLFGIYANRPPMFVLLDEVHVYEGITGAHVAYLLRRMKHLIKQKHPNRGIQFVGLSATLSNASSFFSQLVGIEEKYIEYITPLEKDLVSEGVEYNLVVRGDPFSAASLLSTSVQTAMLLGRMLDPIDKNLSMGAYGSKLFGFTDKLDVINRWFHIEIDAEKNLTLSKYRDYSEVIRKKPSKQVLQQQYAAGQIWLAPTEIDERTLKTPMEVDLTSSQYKGVSEKAKLVIATSTLEVGYNDPKVGGVIQHKAPRNLASFLQRKGRAGRVRGMRPWMVVVSSAYGRDRFVYDFPELFFQPNLNEMYLPIQNSNVLRIQMVFTFMEWLMDRFYKQSKRLDVRYKLSASGQTGHPDNSDLILSLVRDVIEGNDHDLMGYWQKALQVDEDTLKRIAWSEPRSFYFDVLPTLYTQLKENFSFIPKENLTHDPFVGYIPRTLFSSLDISELAIHVPGSDKVIHQSLVQGMMEFAPGNVSKRYVKAYRINEAHWLPLNEDDIVDVNSDVMTSSRVETVQMNDEQSIQVFEPVSITVASIPFEISDRSTGKYIWNLDIKPIQNTSQNIVEFPIQSSLNTLFDQIEYFTSDEHNTVKMTRYALYGEGVKKTSNGIEMPFVSKFVDKGNPCAIGFKRYVDAIRFDVQSVDMKQLLNSPLSNQIISVSKPAFYNYLLMKDPDISGRLNVFLREWMAQIVLSSVTAISISQDVSFKEAITRYQKDHVAISKRTLEAIFHSTIVTDDENASNDPKVKKNLQSIIEDESVMARLLLHLETLEGDLRNNEQFIEWMSITVVDSIAATIKVALVEMLPDVNTEDTNVDIVGNSIWISETESGGLGIITKIVSSMKHSPSLFEELVSSNINHCQRNTITTSLRSVLQHIEDEKMAALVTNIRQEQKFEKQQAYLTELQSVLDQLGIPPKRDLIMSLSNKLFRSNRSNKTDMFMKEIHEFWDQEEERLQFQITPNVFSVASLRREEIKERLNGIMREVNLNFTTTTQAFLFMETFLFHNCHDSCPECLNLYSPFQSFLKPSRLLLQALFKPTHELHRYPSKDFLKEATKSLEGAKRLRVVVPTSEKVSFQSELFRLFHTPIEFKFQLYYPFLERVTNNGDSWYYDVSIREVSYV